MSKLPVALQLYTVRDDCAKDFVGTLKKVAEIGYHGVELAGMHDLSASDVAQQLRSLGLTVAGFPTGIETLTDELDATIECAKLLECRYLVCSYMPDELRGSADDWRTVAARLSTIGQRCSDNGIGLCYHNHSFEFQQFDGEYGLDIFFAAADPERVKSELDVYWVKHGGADPVELMKKYRGRIPLVHLKDMEPGPDRAFAEVGEGTLDIAGVIAEAEAGGSEWLIVEQDACKRPPLESARISFDNLKNMGKA